METKYRSTSTIHSQPISSDEGEIHSDSDSDVGGPLWSNKRVKNGDEKPVVPQIFYQKPAKTKNANVWGAVLAEQNTADISSSFGAVGMQYHVSRGPESFDMPKLPKESASSGSEEVAKPSHKEKKAKKGGNRNQRKRKMPKNKNNVPSYQPGQSVTLHKRCELSDTDPVDKVADELTFRLWERKRDLIRSITEVLGVPKAIDFYNKTENIEKSGGLMIMNGARRRTPGGTFLYLVRNDPKVDQEPIKKVFELEAERERALWELKRSVKTSNHCDGMETTVTSNDQEISSVEMSVSNEQSGKEGVTVTNKEPDVIRPISSDRDLEIENPDEEVDTFG